MQENNIKFNFEDLKIYNKGLDFIDWVYQITVNFPNEERYALTLQLKRAAQSIALNIVEGTIGTRIQFIRYLKIARGSAYECMVCFTIAKNLRYIEENIYIRARMKIAELSKMICGLIESIK